jgi:hypothetical protein
MARGRALARSTQVQRALHTWRLAVAAAAPAFLFAACNERLAGDGLDGSLLDAGALLDASDLETITVLEAGATDRQPAEHALRWLRREVELEADGRSAPLTFELAGREGETFALRTYAVDATESRALCFQLEEVRADAHIWVPQASTPDYGDYCTRCEQPVAVGSGYGLFILPSAASTPAVVRTIELRVALRDCLTLAPLSAAAARPRKLVVESATSAAPARDARLVLPVVIVEATPQTFGSEGARLERVFSRMREIWSVAGIELALRGPFALARPLSPVVYGATDRSALSALALGAEALAAQAGVELSAPRIVLTPCLVRDDPLRGGFSQPLALTAHLPGGFGVHEEPDGIFVAGERCGGLTPAALYAESETLAAVLSHELGHYLGLFHVRESDGREDRLSDTSGDTANLMQTQPSAGATSLTESQIRIARRHLALAVPERE